MAVTRLSLAVLSIFAFCAIRKGESAIVLVEATFMEARVLIINDLNLSLTIEGPGLVKGVGHGQQHFKIEDMEKKEFTFTGPGMVTVTEDGNMIVIAQVGGSYFSLVRTHSEANLAEVLGNISLSQNASILDLKIRGDEKTKHSFSLWEDESTEKQVVLVNRNNITVRQTSNADQINQTLFVKGIYPRMFRLDQDKSSNKHQEIIIRASVEPHTTIMKKTLIRNKGITTVVRQYEKRLHIRWEYYDRESCVIVRYHS